MDDQILYRVAETMKSVLGIPDDILIETVIFDHYNSWDSIIHLNLVVALEDEFEIEFNDEDIASLISQEAITKIISSHKL